MIKKDGKKPRSQKVGERAEKKMDKAKVSWTKAEQARKDAQSKKGGGSALHPKTGNLEAYANKMYGKAAAQSNRAKATKEKSERLKQVEAVKKRKK